MTEAASAKHICEREVRCPSCGRFLCEVRSKAVQIRLKCKCKANVLIQEESVTILK